GKILRFPLDDPKLAKAETLVDTTKAMPLPDGLKPASTGSAPRPMSIDSFVAGRHAIYVAMMAGGPSELLTFDHAGKPLGSVRIPPISAVNELVRLGDDDLLFRDGSFTTAPAWFRSDAKTQKVTTAPLRSISPV